jgi:hypothetical protein
MPAIRNLVSYWQLNEHFSLPKFDVRGAFGTNHMLNAGPDAPPINGPTMIVGDTQCMRGTWTVSNQEYAQSATKNGIVAPDKSFTVFGWMQPQQTNHGLILASIWDSSSNQRGWSVSWSPGDNFYRMLVSSNGIDQPGILTSPDTFAVNTTRFVVGWYNGDDDTVNIQIDNGTIYSAAGPSALHNSTADFRLGSAIFASLNSLAGQLQGVGYAQGVLTAGEKTWLWNDGDGRLWDEFGDGDNNSMYYYYPPIGV